MKLVGKIFSRASLLSSAGGLALILATTVQPAAAVVPNDNLTPEDIIDDEVNVTGVGMFFRADGFVCSGTLINPRTVLFAAHCVNDVPENVYGTSLPAAWSFQTNALPGFQAWFNDFQSHPDLFVYNVNQILYHQDSLARPESLGFLEADIALSSLADPATGVPTWALMFAPLPTPETIDPVTGTGYHVDIVGYGRSGNGTSGAFQGIDFRRRAAENMLGALLSFSDRDEFIYGDGGGLTSSLYSIDFDDPNQSNPFDFNLFRDEPLEREGSTAGGDSGGPLILDAANNSLAAENLVIGVLSGGSRFFSPQPFSSYGTQSFYQPLFLYWDWIAANNPYRYVGAQAGDGNWEDASHWISLQDPSYRILNAAGEVVTGTPTSPGGGIFSDGPDFGEICFDPQPRGEGLGDACQNLETGEIVEFGLTEGSVETGKGKVSFETLLATGLTGGDQTKAAVGSETTDARGRGLDPAALDTQSQADGYSDEPLPEPTLANGLPGATDFVPDNVTPDPLAGVNARYFDVILSQAGTTTLSSNVEIDRLTLMGGAGLNIADDGDLSVLIDIMQTSGTMNVDGGLMSVGDYLMVAGLLSGTGTVTTPFLTNVAGGIAPGGVGNVGQLTIDGSLILSSGSTLLIDLSTTGSDTLNVTGDVSLGGVVALNGPVAFGDVLSILTFGGTSSGSFDDVVGLGGGVLQAVLTNSETSVDLTVTAESFLSVLPDSVTGSQLSYAQAFDDARETNYAGLQDIYSVIDYISGSTLTDVFDRISPNDAVVSGQGMLAMGDALSQRLSARMRELRRGERGFSVKGTTAQLTPMMDAPSRMTTSAGDKLGIDGADTAGKSYDMKSGLGGFATIDIYSADADTGFASDDAELEGYAITAGFDGTLENGAVIGALLSYSSSENTLESGFGKADTDGYTFGVYGYYPIVADLYIDGFASFGSLSLDTQRNAVLPAATFSAKGDTDADQVLAGITLGKQFSLENGVNITPSASVLHASYDIEGYTETGGSIALAVDSRKIESTQLSVGAVIDWEMGETGNIRPMVGASVVHDLDSGTDIVTGTLAGAPGSAQIVFAGPDRSETWFDIEAGIDFDVSDRIVGTLSVKQTLNRDDLSQTVFGGAVQIKF